MNRKTSVLIEEFWSNWSILLSIVLALSPFLILLSARGMFFPLLLGILFLFVSGIVCMINAIRESVKTIRQENDELLKTLRGQK